MFYRIFYFWLGLGILFANKIRYAIRGYRTPRLFDVKNIQQAIDYDTDVVQKWGKQLCEYTGEENVIFGKRILELGPGNDLGNAFILLSLGAAHYTSLDVNNLIAEAPDQLYEKLFSELKKPELRTELQNYKEGKSERIRTVVDSAFSLKQLAYQGINLVLSQAAFEHFDDVQRVITQLGSVVENDAIFCAEIDLQTHTGVVRERDPLSIYRIPTFLYRLAHFTGIPNRVRPYQYVSWMEQNGWHDIRLIPLLAMDSAQMKAVGNGLARRFQDPKNQMEILHFLLLARRKSDSA